MWKDSETNIDLLDFDYLIGITKNIIINDDLSPSSIGVYGDWGSGKSSLMEMTLRELANILKLDQVKMTSILWTNFKTLIK